MKKLVCFWIIVLSFQVFGIKKNICFNVQTSTPLSLRADIVSSEGSPVRLLGKQHVEMTSLPIVGGVFRVILNQGRFGPCSIAIKNTDTDIKLVDIIIERTHQDSSPKVTLSNQRPNLKYALYKPMAGGGVRFVLAIGNTNADVAMQAVKDKQGSMQSYSLVH